MVFIWTTGGNSRQEVEKEIGNCQFCNAINSVDLYQQVSETKLFGLFAMNPQVHRIAKCRKCSRAIKEEYYQGRTKPVVAAAQVQEEKLGAAE